MSSVPLNPSVDVRAVVLGSDGLTYPPVKTNTDGSLAVGGFSANAAVTLTRPANVTAYTAQDEVATGGTAPAAFPVSRLTGLTGLITGARLIYASNPSTTPALRLLLFSAAVTAAGDNNPLALSGADANTFLGCIDFSTTQAGGATTGSPLMMFGSLSTPIEYSVDTVYGVLITTNGFTPVANGETIQIALQLERN